MYMDGGELSAKMGGSPHCHAYQLFSVSVNKDFPIRKKSFLIKMLMIF
jgi:hypothetical protein